MKILTFIISNELNAGPKAPRDIVEILKKEYNANSITYYYPNDLNQRIKEKIRKIYLIWLAFTNKDLLIIQFPFINNKWLMKRLAKNNIVIIHDLDSIRYNLKDETDILNNFKYIVCHNNKMRNYLIDKGIPKEKIYTLDLFDYLCDNKINDYKENSTKEFNIAYAGNLIKSKSPFLYQLDSKKMDFKLSLYGVGIDKNINDKIIYKGSFIPSDLPNNIESSLGLIWDGNFDESDENFGFKNYTKYNNPHKLSCYVAAGIPVIVWSKSAIAEFVTLNNIGYTINNLYDINKLKIDDYDIKKSNILKLSNKVRNGYFTKKVIDNILKKN